MSIKYVPGNYFPLRYFICAKVNDGFTDTGAGISSFLCNIEYLNLKG